MGQGTVPSLLVFPLLLYILHTTAVVTVFRTEQIELYIVYDEVRGRENSRTTHDSLVTLLRSLKIFHIFLLIFLEILIAQKCQH